MKAIQLQETGSFDSLKLVEIETPSPRDTQILVRMVAISGNYADTLIRKGTYSIMPALPTIPGLEGSGVVAEVGPQVTHIRTGQPVIVFHHHCYAEYVLADSQTVFPISDLIRPDEAAVLPVVYLTAYHLLFTMGMIKPKQRYRDAHTFWAGYLVELYRRGPRGKFD